jgi:hypothetical protein
MLRNMKKLLCKYTQHFKNIIIFAEKFLKVMSDTGTTLKFTENVYDEISQACTDAGIPLQHVCREAGVDRSVLERWKKENPKSIKILNALSKALDKLKHAKSNTHE